MDNIKYSTIMNIVLCIIYCTITQNTYNIINIVLCAIYCTIIQDIYNIMNIILCAIYKEYCTIMYNIFIKVVLYAILVFFYTKKNIIITYTTTMT
jgi:hypothetical protein